MCLSRLSFNLKGVKSFKKDLIIAFFKMINLDLIIEKLPLSQEEFEEWK